MKFLLKFIDKKDADSMLNGNILFRESGYFVDLEEEQSNKDIGDALEGVWQRRIDKESHDMYIQDEGGEWVYLDFEKATFKQTYNEIKKIPITCFAILDIPEDFYEIENKYTIKSEIINNLIKEEFGKRDVIIIEFYTFMKRFKNKLKLLKYGYKADKIKYYTKTHPLSSEEYNNNPFHGLFYKESFFSYQKEYRIALRNPLETDPSLINIGDIRDIAFQISPNNLENVKIELTEKESK